jgi:uncharacterized protein (DUF1697 family)
MTQCIALIRGINVGKAKRVAMSDLRASIEELGYDDVRTLLNSGNVLFRATRPRMAALAQEIEAGIVAKLGVSARVIVFGSAELNAIIREDPLRSVVSDPARYMVAFVSRPSVLADARGLLQESWAPEAFAVGARAAYLWCANGVIESKVAKAFGRVAGDTVTTRNWATVLKLQSASERAD